MQTTHTKTHNKTLRIVLGILGTLLIVSILFLAAINLFAKDISPIDDSDLRLDTVVVSGSDNAYFDLLKIENILQVPPELTEDLSAMARGDEWDPEVAQELIALNDEAFQILSDASRKPRYQDPAFADPRTISPTMDSGLNLGSLRTLVKLSALRALYLHTQGRNAESMTALFEALEVSQNIQNSQLDSITYLVTVALKGVALEAMQSILSSTAFTSIELKNYTQKLNGYYTSEQGLSNAFKSEYHMYSSVIDSIVLNDLDAMHEPYVQEIGNHPLVRNALTKNYYFQPNATKKLFAEHYRALIQNTHTSCVEVAVPNRSVYLPSSYFTFFTWYGRQNRIGQMLYVISVTEQDGWLTFKCNQDLRVSMTQVFIASKAYKLDNGTYPASLNDLVPEYLQTVPVDPFDGKKLRYLPETQTIYSVGENFSDEGGKAGDVSGSLSDPIFKVIH